MLATFSRPFIKRDHPRAYKIGHNPPESIESQLYEIINLFQIEFKITLNVKNCKEVCVSVRSSRLDKHLLDRRLLTCYTVGVGLMIINYIFILKISKFHLLTIGKSDDGSIGWMWLDVDLNKVIH